MRLRVGVVIPAFNAEDFILSALDSVRAQSRKADHISVVDDGSADQTASLVEGWIAANPEIPITLIREIPNRGLSHARNCGIANTDAECIATLDADDLFEPDHLERLMSPLERESDVILSFGDAREFSSAGVAKETLLERAGSNFRNLPSDDKGTYRVLGGSVFRSLLQGSFVPVSGSVFRRDAAIEVGLYDPGLRRVEDRDFLLRLARAGKFAFVPFVACRKRIHDGNISGSKYHFRMAEGGFGALMRARELVRQGSIEDRTAIEQSLAQAAEDMIYSASISGIDVLASTAVIVYRAGFRSASRSPKAWMRAVWHEVRALVLRKSLR